MIWLAPPCALAQTSHCEENPAHDMSPLVESCQSAAPCKPSCVRCGQTGKYVLVKDCDPNKSHAYLLMPTSHIDGIGEEIGGIESPHVLSTPLEDMWDDAWKESLNSQETPLLQHSTATTGLAVNSTCGRSYQPLHIHISCVEPEVQKCLACNHDRIASGPATPSLLRLNGHIYAAVRVGDISGDHNPFRVVQRIPHVANHMDLQGVAVVGSTNAGEFYILDTYCQAGDRGHAERLLNQDCAEWTNRQATEPTAPVPPGKMTCDDECFPAPAPTTH
jgi:CDP-diacylglycerol pyrophosphatase